MKLRIGVVGLVAGVVAGLAHAEVWLRIPTAAAIEYVDANRLTKTSDGLVDAHVKRVLDKPVRLPGGFVVAYLIEHDRYDCGRASASQLSVTPYGENGPVPGGITEPQPFRPVSRDTVQHTEMEFLCARTSTADKPSM
jgi:hypothetical protein